MQSKISVGFHAPTWTESARSTMDGILRYLAEEPYIGIRDFRYSISDENFAGVPPWRGKVDGVIVIAGNSPGVVQWLQRGEVPVVCAVGDLIGGDIPCFFPQSASLARLTVDHALDAGFRQVAYVGTRETNASALRCEALESQAKLHQLKFHPLELLATPNINYDQPSDDASQAPVRSFLARFSAPTLVACFNDRIASMIVREARAMGLAIPEQVGVLGAGDTTFARLSDPPISSIRLNREETGYQAVRCLHARIQGIGLEQTQFEVPAIALAARESTVVAKPTPTTDAQRALEFIQRHACDGIQLQTVAQTVNVPLRTLEIEFKKTTGRTMGDVIQQIRLDRAKHLLETTSLSTQRIANLVGFSHYSCLNRMTARMLNMTPAQYRKQRSGDGG